MTPVDIKEALKTLPDVEKHLAVQALMHDLEQTEQEALTRLCEPVETLAAFIEREQTFGELRQARAMRNWISAWKQAAEEVLETTNKPTTHE